MTNANGSDRLDRMEALLSETIQGLVETRLAIAQTKQITESNARAIQAMVEARATERLEQERKNEQHEQQMQELASIMNRVVALQNGLGKMTANIDSDRPTILRKLNTIENKVDKLDNLERIENKIDRIIEEN